MHVQLGELRGVSGALRVATDSVQRLTGSLDPDVRLLAFPWQCKALSWEGP